MFGKRDDNKKETDRIYAELFSLEGRIARLEEYTGAGREATDGLWEKPEFGTIAQKVDALADFFEVDFMFPFHKVVVAKRGETRK